MFALSVLCKMSNSNFESVLDVLGVHRPHSKYDQLNTDSPDQVERGPNEFRYPPNSTLVCRLTKEFAATYFLCFIYGMTTTDPAISTNYVVYGILTGGAMLLVMTLFKGTAGNPWFTMLDTFFGHPHRTFVYPISVLSIQLSGAVFAFYTVSCLRHGAQYVTPALNRPTSGTTDLAFIFVEALFTFALCHAYNLLHREPSDKGFAIIRTSWAPYVTSVVVALAIGTTGSLGAGSCNFMKTLGAATIVGDYNGVWQVFVGGIIGTVLSAAVFASSYL